MNLGFYVTEQDYQVWAGPDWPSYQDYLAGARGTSPDIQKEIGEFTDRYVSQGIKFPIKTETACQSKWTWSTIYLNTLSTASCHRVIPVRFDAKDFDSFHNHPKKISDRNLMLQGQWPRGGCEYCQQIEQSGGWSDRQHNLDIRGLTPPELEQDPTAVHVTPRILEIFAQNTCNLACLYCNAGLSSRIENENIQHGEFRKDGVHIPVYHVPDAETTEMFERFMDWLERNVRVLRRLHLLGGETFIQHGLMERVLGVLENHPNPDLEFCIFSNLNVPEKYWQRYIGQIQQLQKDGHIKVFDLTASIDCWGPEQEYVRSGLDLSMFEQRFAWAADQDPAWLRLNANQTITAMTVRTMPELINKITHYSRKRHIGHYFQFYTGLHMFHHPKIYAYDFWAEDFDRILAAMPQDTQEQREAIPRMIGHQRLLQQSHTHELGEIQKLMVYLDEIDRRRGTRWRDLFNYLDVTA